MLASLVGLPTLFLKIGGYQNILRKNAGGYNANKTGIQMIAKRQSQDLQLKIPNVPVSFHEDSVGLIVGKSITGAGIPILFNLFAGRFYDVFSKKINVGEKP